LYNTYYFNTKKYNLKTNKMKQTAVEWIFEELENKENGFPYLTLEQI
jgi:hypothetical protein